MVVTSIDSIVINGNYRKRYNYNGTYGTIERFPFSNKQKEKEK